MEKWWRQLDSFLEEKTKIKSVRTIVVANHQISAISGWSSMSLISAGVEPAKFQQKLTFAFKNQSNLDAVCNLFTDLFCYIMNVHVSVLVA